MTAGDQMKILLCYLSSIGTILVYHTGPFSNGWGKTIYQVLVTFWFNTQIHSIMDVTKLFLELKLF